MPSQMKTAFPTFNGYAPAQGPKALPVDMDFSQNATQSFDLTLETTEGIIDYVQSVYVDNSSNPNELELIFGVTNQKLVIPATAQGIWPIIAPNQTRVIANSTVAVGAKSNIILMNVPMPYTQWGPQTVNVNANIDPISRGTYTDYSSNITTGGSSQLFVPANANRKGFVIQNPSNEFEIIHVNFGGPATVTDCIELAPSAKWISGATFSTETIEIMAATTGHHVLVKELV